MKKYLVLDIGGSSIKCAVINEALEIEHLPKAVTPYDGVESLIHNIQEVYISNKDVVGIAISMPGIINSKEGIAVTAGALKYIENEPLAKEISEACDNKPVTLINDGNAAVLAELGYGNLKGIENGAVFVFGTGVGGGLVINHQFVEGVHHSAGEFSVIREGLTNQDSYFHFVGGIEGLSRAVEATTGKKDLKGIEIFEMIKDGNEAAKKGVENFCDNVAYYIYNIQSIIDGDRFCIGGGISQEPMFVEMMKDAVERIYQRSLPGLIGPEIMVCKYYNDSNLIGALYNYQRLMEGK